MKPALLAQRMITHVGADTGRDTPPCVRWIGFMSARGAGRARIAEAIETLHANGSYALAGTLELLNTRVADGARAAVVDITGHWLDVNDFDALCAAGDFAQGDTP